MKLIIAILQDPESETVSHALTSDGFRVTVIASTGGFLRKGNTTLLIGVEDEQQEKALSAIRTALGPAPDPQVKRATVFVIKVDESFQL